MYPAELHMRLLAWLNSAWKRMCHFAATGTSAQMQQSPESFHLHYRLITKQPLPQFWHIMSLLVVQGHRKGHSTFPLPLPAQTVETQMRQRWPHVQLGPLVKSTEIVAIMSTIRTVRSFIVSYNSQTTVSVPCHIICICWCYCWNQFVAVQQTSTSLDRTSFSGI